MRMAALTRSLAGGGAAAFVLNLVWENVAAPLYNGYTGPAAHFARCLVATGGDLVLTLLIYLLVAAVRRDVLWIRDAQAGDFILVAALGLATDALTEWWGLAAGRWSYAPTMPIVPLLHVGLTPFVQLAMTTTMTVALLQRFMVARPRLAQNAM